MTQHQINPPITCNSSNKELCKFFKWYNEFHIRGKALSLGDFVKNYEKRF